MASIIKNQIIKHLSAFARNIKPEQISVEVLRGKGQLRDLELNEDVLTERLELPPWLKIVKAHCSSVSVKIPWTKLKSAPVQLFVEEIRVTIRLVASAIPNTKKSGLSLGKPYDLAERVIEGISMYVQSIELTFETDSQSNINFAGSIMMSQFVLESRNPNWQEESNINKTRIHDKTIRQVLFFKHVSWRVLKIEASANLKSEDKYHNSGTHGQSHRSSLNSPLRFLTENGRCKIVIKKNTLDCSLIAGRIELILDEIHWLAYMAHLRSAIDFYKHILDLANSVGKEIPMLKQQQGYMDHQRPSISSNPSPSLSSTFRQLDIPQSSYHLIISRIDLHLCDDSSTDDLPPDWNIESGAMQAIVQKLRVDFYPQHRVFEQNGDFSARNTWLRYTSPNPFTGLAKMQLDQHFRILANKMEPNHRDRFARIWPQLTSQNVVIRIENLIIQSVSERSTKKDALRCMFLMNKREKEKLPQHMSFFHLEYTGYNFPATSAYSVPPDSIHLVLAPFEFSPDPKSIRWLVYTLENILNSLDAPQISGTNCSTSSTESQRPDIRIELVMPKVVIMPNDLPSLSSSLNSQQQCAIDSRLPRRFLANASTLFFSNFTLLNDPQVPLPLMFKNKIHAAHIEFIKWAERCSGNNTASNANTGSGVTKYLERRSNNFEDKFLFESQSDGPTQEWFISIPTLWVNSDFGPDTWELPLLADLSIFGCLANEQNENKQLAGNTFLLEPRTDIGVTLDHFQFVQFIEFIDRLSSLTDQISSDKQFFRKHLSNLPNDLPLHFFLQCEKIHLRLILPPGPTPSPYDTKWTGSSDVISPSNTSISCSDLPNDETIISTNTSALNSMKKQQKPSSSSDLNNIAAAFEPRPLTPSATLTEETIGGLAVQGGLKTIDSLGEVSQIAVTSKLPVEVQVSRKLMTGPTNLPDYAGISTPTDLESNLDETLSITTSASAEQLTFDGIIIGCDKEEVMEAEEALESGEQYQQDLQMLRHKEKLLGREVNIFDILLEDLNVHARAMEGRTTALGFASNIYVGERLRRNCGNVYAEKGATFEAPISPDQLKMMESYETIKPECDKPCIGNPMNEAKLKLEVHSAPKQSVIKVDINGINICLSDEVISQLSPFIQNSSEDNNPAALELSLQRCKIEIKDPKKRFPLRIRLGELSIQDGPEGEKRCE